jgi:hypothetical protein
MAEQEVLGDQRLTVAHGRPDKAEQKQQVLEYGWNIMPLSAWIYPADSCTLTRRCVTYRPDDTINPTRSQPTLYPPVLCPQFDPDSDNLKN